MNLKTVPLTDQLSKLSADAVIVRRGNQLLVKIGSVFYTPADIFLLAQETLFAGPITPEGEKFVANIRGVVKGDGPEGERFRPSVDRQMAGTHTGRSAPPVQT